MAVRLGESPAVALLGPRQVGKTTLALAVAEGRPAVYLGLESSSDRSKLTDAELYLREHLDKLVVLDEIHLAPGLAVDGKTIASYLDLFVDLLLVRRLPAWHRNTGKRLTRSPKVYVRDSGLLQ